MPRSATASRSCFAEGCTNFRRLPVFDAAELELEIFASPDLSGAPLSERRVRRPDFTWLGVGRPGAERASVLGAPLRHARAGGRAASTASRLTCVGRARLLRGRQAGRGRLDRARARRLLLRLRQRRGDRRDRARGRPPRRAGDRARQGEPRRRRAPRRAPRTSHRATRWRRRPRSRAAPTPPWW